LLRDKVEIHEAFECMQAFRKERFRNSDLLQDSRFYNFYAKVAIAGTASEFARTYSLSLDGRTIAVVFGVSYRKRFLFLLLGFNVADLRSYSLGLLAIEDTIRDCTGRGDQVFDLTIGDEPYKAKFASVRTPMFIQWTGNGAVGAIAGAVTVGSIQIRSVLGWIKSRRFKFPWNIRVKHRS
jgi:CelD/BcsL family acetyltransferase involved in cellulose biosynthesis